MKYLTWAWLITLMVVSGCASSRNSGSANVDWRARARSVHIGMTRDEVQLILPLYEPLTTFSTYDVLTERAFVSTDGSGSIENYWVSADWQVTVTYTFRDGQERVSARVEVIKTKFPEIGPVNPP